MTLDEKLLNRVRGLLAKAERTDNPHEAEVFSAKAAELIDAYRISPAALADAKKATDYGRTTYVLHGAKYLRASLNLLVVVADHYGVVVLTPSTGNSKYPSLVGDEADVEAVKLLFGSLLVQRDRAALAERVPYGVNTNTYRNSFAYGYASRIGDRLRALRSSQVEAATADGNGTALEVYDRKGLVLKWLSDLLNDGKGLGSSTRNRPNIDAAGYMDGDAAARHADLGQDRLPGDTGPRAIGAGR